MKVQGQFRFKLQEIKFQGPNWIGADTSGENWRITLSPKWHRFTFPVSSSSSSRSRGEPPAKTKSGNAAQVKCRPNDLPKNPCQSCLPQPTTSPWSPDQNPSPTVQPWQDCWCPNPSEKPTLPSHAYQEKRCGLGKKPGMIPIKGQPKSNTKKEKRTEERRKNREKRT